MREYEAERVNHPNMEYYRRAYKESKRWDGDELDGKRVIVYMEQGYGDQIMFLRFVRFLKAKECHITLHAPKALHRVISTLGVEVIDKDNPNLPDHDLHILSLSLPFVLQCPIPLEPYIQIPEKTELPQGWNIGIAWEGSRDHENNTKRSCPLKHFKKLQKEGVNLFCLLPEIKDQSLLAECEDMDLNGVELTDFYDTAKLINSLDLVVSVDTAALHLSGAMGKAGYGLLNPEVRDHRWDYIWYPTMMMLKGTWEQMFEKVK